MMKLRYDKTLITGKPGQGKTSFIKKIIEQMGSVSMAGFYTGEIRSKGCRQGFELQGLNGKRGILAHRDIHGQHRVGKYGVDTVGFEEFLDTLGLLNPNVELIVIDEIGKMELFSTRFQSLVFDALNSDKQLLASISIGGTGFIHEIKKRSDIHLVELTHNNRNHLEDVILGRMK